MPAPPYFDAAIPGQSLTGAPGNAKWEYPAQYNNPEDAVESIYDEIMKPKNLKEFGYIIKQGAYIEEIAKTVIFAGFTEGKWTVDTGMLMFNAVVVMLASVAKKLGILDPKKITPAPKAGPAELSFKKNKLMDAVKKMRLDEEQGTDMSVGGLMAPPAGGFMNG